MTLSSILHTAISPVTFIYRLCRLIFLVTVYGIGYFFAVRVRRGKDRKEIRGEWLRSFIIHMGPLYIKFGQIMSTRSDVFDQKMIRALQILQDNVPAMSVRNTLRSIARYDIFESFDSTPVASGSIAQVHRARLKGSGETVAVKIIKKNVRDNIRQNIFILRSFIKIASLLMPSLRYYQALERFDEVARVLWQQTDLWQEAKNMERIGRTYRSHPYVVIPRVHLEHCDRDMLVMEFMTGIPGREAERVKIPRKILAERMINFLLDMIWCDGFFHADSHPGNIFFTEDGRIILLDFGIMGSIDEDDKWELSVYYHSIAKGNWAEAVRRYTACFIRDKSGIDRHWNEYREDMTACLKKHFGSSRWDTQGFFVDSNRILLKYHTKESPKWTTMDLCTISGEGFCTQIDPTFEITKCLEKFSNRYSPFLDAHNQKELDGFFSRENFPRLTEMHEDARQFLIAPTHNDRIFFPNRYPMYVKKAYGCKYEDFDNHTYIDLSSGYGPHILGYNHPVISEAIAEAARDGGISCIGNSAEVELMREIVSAIPSAEKGLFTNSGTESGIVALSLCRAYRKRDLVAKCEGHYHGFFDHSMVSNWFRVKGPEDAPLPIKGSAGTSAHVTKNTLVLQYGHPHSIERIRRHADDLACVLVEPFHSACVTYDIEWLRALREVCTETGVPLIFDEVVTAFRVSYNGFQSIIGIMPDLTCLAKIIGAGLPCGAVVGKAEILDMTHGTEDPFRDYEEKAFSGGTLSGNSITCRAGLSQLKYLKEHPEIYDQLQEKSDWLAREVDSIAAEFHVPMKLKTYRSICLFYFGHKDPLYYRNLATSSNIKAIFVLCYYMRKYGVYLPELHLFMLNHAHRKEDLETVAEALRRSVQDMIKAGVFVE